MKKAALEKAKAIASADAMKDKKLMDLAKMKTDRESKQALADYYKAMDPKIKLSAPGQIVKEIKDGLYGPLESLDIYTVNAAGDTIIDGDKLINLATSMVPTIGAAEIRRETTLTGQAGELIEKYLGSFYGKMEVDALIKEGLTEEQAKDRVRLQKRAQVRNTFNLDKTEENYSGGVVGQSVQNFNDVVKTINA